MSEQVKQMANFKLNGNQYEVVDSTARASKIRHFYLSGDALVETCGVTYNEVQYEIQPVNYTLGHTYTNNPLEIAVNLMNSNVRLYTTSLDAGYYRCEDIVDVQVGTSIHTTNFTLTDGKGTSYTLSKMYYIPATTE